MAVNYQRLKKIRRLIYSGYTIAEIAKECNLEKRQVKALIAESNLCDATKEDLKKIWKRNKRFSKKTLYIDTCGFNKVEISSVIKWFPKVVVIRDVIDEMENFQYTNHDKVGGKNIRWFLKSVANKELDNVQVVSTDEISSECYTDNRFIDYLKSLPTKEKKKAIVLTNDNGFSCKLQAYEIDYFGYSLIEEMRAKCEKLTKNPSKKENNGEENNMQNNSEIQHEHEDDSKVCEAKAEQRDSKVCEAKAEQGDSKVYEAKAEQGDSKVCEAKAEQGDSKVYEANAEQGDSKACEEKVKQEESANHQEPMKTAVPGVRVIGKTLYSDANETTFVMTNGGYEKKVSVSNLIPLRYGDIIIKVENARKSKIKIRVYKIQDVLRERCAIYQGEIVVSSKQEIDNLNYPNMVKAKLKYLYTKFKI